MSEDSYTTCSQTVYVRDTYRYSGRGPSGFSMHYRRQSCSRRAQESGFCWQHQPGYLSRMVTERWQAKLRRAALTAEGHAPEPGGGDG